jgi:hypothetical protein
MSLLKAPWGEVGGIGPENQLFGKLEQYGQTTQLVLGTGNPFRSNDIARRGNVCPTETQNVYDF